MTTAIEVAIGLILLYLTLSLVVSAIQEGIAALLGLRARYLAQGIENLLGESLKKEFYGHDLIKALSKKAKDKDSDQPKASRWGWLRPKAKGPSYVSKSTFTTVALDLISRMSEGGDLTDAVPDGDKDKDPLASLDALKAQLGVIGADAPQPVVAAIRLFEREEENLAQVKARLEAWFDEAMERVSGWYKRRIKAILFLVGLGLCILMNADTFNVARTLWTDPEVRKAVVAAAEKTAEEDTTPKLTAKEAADAVGNLAELQIPLGWVFDPPDEDEGRDPRELPDNVPEGVVKLAGILITAIALTLGAPFWFDLLKKFVNLRSTGNPEGTNASLPAPAPAGGGAAASGAGGKR